MSVSTALTSQEKMTIDRIAPLFPDAEGSPKKLRSLADSISVFHMEDGESVHDRLEFEDQVFIVVKGALMIVDKEFDPDEEPDGHQFHMVHSMETGSMQGKENMISVGQSYVLSVAPDFYKKELKGRKKVISKLVKRLGDHPELIAGEYDRRDFDARRAPHAERPMKGTTEERRYASDRREEEEEEDPEFE